MNTGVAFSDQSIQLTKPLNPDCSCFGIETGTFGKVPNVVNLARKTPSTCTLVVRHLDRPGVLASVLDAISAATPAGHRGFGSH